MDNFDWDIDLITGKLVAAKKQQQAFVQTSLNRKLLYTKDEVNALISSALSSINRIVSVINSNTNAGAQAETDYVYLVSGATTLTLPTAVNNTNRYTVKNGGANTVIVATSNNQTIDGSSTAVIPVSNTSLDLVSDGSNWRVI